MELQNEQPFSPLACIDEISSVQRKLDSLLQVIYLLDSDGFRPEAVVPLMSDLAALGQQLNQQVREDVERLYDAWKKSSAVDVQH